MSIDNVMVDLETMGTVAGSVIRSIGAVAFDPYTGAIGEKFYANIDPSSCATVGLKVDPKTEEWWAAPERAAARAMLDTDQKPLWTVLGDFCTYWERASGRRFWSQGPSFDPVLLEAAYRACALKAPWGYSDTRDTRTIYEVAGVKPDVSTGVYHGALDDAVRQALAVIEGFRRLRRGSIDWKAGRLERQRIVVNWAAEAFGTEQATALPQRGIRLLEEAVEAAQAAGVEEEMAHKLVTTIFQRPVGEIGQEIGGVSVTLLALAHAAGTIADDEEVREINRVLAKPIAEFTARNQQKNDMGFLAVPGLKVAAE